MVIVIHSVIQLIVILITETAVALMNVLVLIWEPVKMNVFTLIAITILVALKPDLLRLISGIKLCKPLSMFIMINKLALALDVILIMFLTMGIVMQVAIILNVFMIMMIAVAAVAIFLDATFALSLLQNAFSVILLPAIKVIIPLALEIVLQGTD